MSNHRTDLVICALDLLESIAPVNIGHGLVHPGISHVLTGGPCDSPSTSAETVMLARLALPWLLGTLLGATLYPARA